MVTPREAEQPRLSALRLAHASGYEGSFPTVLDKRNLETQASDSC